MDVSSYEWQKFLVSLSKKLSNKNIDGFFVDNCDVYYQYPTEKVFEGLTVILKNLMKHKKTVIINGGDTYVTKYHNRYGSLKDIMTGVNQECVFSKIDFEKKKFTVQEKCDRQYFQKYIEMCKDDELNVYIIEYTKNRIYILQYRCILFVFYTYYFNILIFKFYLYNKIIISYNLTFSNMNTTYLLFHIFPKYIAF